MDGLESVVEGIVDYYGALQGSALEGQRVDGGRLVGVVVGVDPCLWSCFAVWCYDEDDVLRP